MAVFSYSNSVGGLIEFGVKNDQTVNVFGTLGAITNVSITITGLNHTYADDVTMLLVHPDTTHNLLFWGEAGSGVILTGGDYTIADCAPALPDIGDQQALGTSGTYGPAAYETVRDDAFFGSSTGGIVHAPDQGTGSFATSFGGLAPGGNWHLYVTDPFSSDDGSFDGWTLSVETDSPDALVTGGPVVDTITIASTSATGGTLTRNSASFDFSGLTGIFTIKGFGGDDTITGGDGNEIIEGGPGGDTLDGGANGSIGDTLSYASSPAAVDVGFQGSASGGDAEGDSYINFENLTGSSFDDTLFGDGNANIIRGGAGIDLINGLGGSDTLLGEDGDDNLRLFSRDSNSGITTFDGGADFDTLSISGASFVVNLTDDILLNIERIETAAFNGDGKLIILASQMQSLTEFDEQTSVRDFTLSIEMDIASLDLSGINFTGFVQTGDVVEVIGTSAAETIIASHLDDILIGDAGADTLDGGPGNDTMRGGADNDTYIITDAGDVADESVAGSSGVDVARGTITIDLLSGNFLGDIENIALVGYKYIDALGNSLDNFMTGNSLANTLDGRSGADTMRGKGGNDIYIVDDPGDFVSEAIEGSKGIDTVRSSVSFNLSNAQQAEGDIEKLELTGTLNAFAVGNALANTITGNSGANMINGKGGYDTLTGGEGADSFRFTTALGSNSDTITDFLPGTDKIELDSAIFVGLSAGALSADNFRDLSTGFKDANDFIIYNPDNGKIFYDSDGSGPASLQAFAVITAGLALTAADFVVI